VFVPILKLLTDVPSDVYSNVTWSGSSSIQSVPRHSPATVNVLSKLPLGLNSNAGSGPDVVPGHTFAGVAAPTNTFPDVLTKTDSGEEFPVALAGKLPNGPTRFPFTSNLTTPVGSPNVVTYKFPDRSKAIPAESGWPVLSVPIIVPSG